MHTFFALVIVCLAVAVHGLPNPRIVGGKDAPVGKFPHQVSLRKQGSHSCGGSIINKRTVLTAAHCIIGYVDSPRSLESLTIHAGTNLLSETGVVYKAERAIAHENFDSWDLVNDIGLLILSNLVEYTNLIKPIPLATTDVAPPGHSCTLSGWGRTSLGGLVPNNLQEIELNVYDQEKCKKSHWRVQPSHICTLTKKDEGACHGDSGSALLANGVQIGIVSFGEPCARGAPDVFTRVASFQDWLKEHVVDE